MHESMNEWVNEWIQNKHLNHKNMEINKKFVYCSINVKSVAKGGIKHKIYKLNKIVKILVKYL